MNKRIWAFLLACCLLLTFCACGAEPGTAEDTTGAADPVDTTGTDATDGTQGVEVFYPRIPEEPEPEPELKPDFSGVDEMNANADGVYQIHTAEGLANMANHPEGKFELLWNIDMAGAQWTPVAAFTGTFDGKGYTVSNLVITAGADGNTGFIGINKGTVQNLKLADVQIEASTGYVGGLAGQNAGTLSASTVAGTMKVTGNTVAGGLVGKADTGTITYCDAGLRIEADASATVGLLGGELQGVTLTNCVYSGAMNRKDGKLFTDLAGTASDVTYTGCLWRDNTNSDELLSAEALQLRQTVEQKMRAMGSIEWTVDETLSFFHTNGSPLHTQIFVAGETYWGLPYTGKSGDLSRFLYCFNEDGTVKDFVKQNPVGADNFDMYMGVDCSSAVYWAWVTVSPSTAWRWTQNMLGFQGEGGVPVGQYEGATTLSDTMDIFGLNGDQVMAEAYAKLHKGDACTTYYTDEESGRSQNHARMMVTNTVVYRTTDGSIDLEKSYFNTHEQGDGLYDYKNTSWIIDGTYSFKTMCENYYAPLSCQELLDGKSPACVVTVDNDKTGKAYMTTGIVETNYRLISTTITIKDEAGEPVWEQTLFTSVDKFANSGTDLVTRTTVRSFDLAAFAAYIGGAELESGKTYTYELSAVPGTGEKVVLKTFEFVN